MKAKTVTIISTLTALAVGLLLTSHTGRAAFNELRLTATLNGANEVPPITTDASGVGNFIINTADNTLHFDITVQGLSSTETAAHIHGPAEIGINAGVLFPLPLGNIKTGVWNYPEAAEADIISGRTYVNVHSITSPGGEIRGQIMPLF